jgi:hypothetical protein
VCARLLLRVQLSSLLVVAPEAQFATCALLRAGHTIRCSWWPLRPVCHLHTRVSPVLQFVAATLGPHATCIPLFVTEFGLAPLAVFVISSLVRPHPSLVCGPPTLAQASPLLFAFRVQGNPMPVFSLHFLGLLL